MLKLPFVIALMASLMLGGVAASLNGEAIYDDNFKADVSLTNKSANAQVGELLSKGMADEFDQQGVSHLSASSLVTFYFQHTKQLSHQWLLESINESLYSFPSHVLAFIPFAQQDVWFILRKKLGKHRLAGWKDANLQYKKQHYFHA